MQLCGSEAVAARAWLCSCEVVWTPEKLMSLIHNKTGLNVVPQLRTRCELDILEVLNHISYGRCDRVTLYQVS